MGAYGREGGVGGRGLGEEDLPTDREMNQKKQKLTLVFCVKINVKYICVARINFQCEINSRFSFVWQNLC